VARGDRSGQARERTAEERERDREERERRRGRLPADAPAPPPPPATPPLDPPAETPSLDPLLSEAPPPVEEQAEIEPPPAEPLFDAPPLEQSVTQEPVGSASEPPLDPLAFEELLPIEEPVAFEEPLPVEEPAAIEAPAPPPPKPPAVGLPPLPPELGGTSKRASRTPSRRSPLARIVAVVALLAVIAALILLLVPQLRSSNTKTIAAPKIVKVLIPEGKTRAQIAEIAAADHLSGDYVKAAKRSSLLNPVHYGAPHGTSDLEGFLFPATYDMTVGEPVSRLVEEQLVAFRENFTESQVARARALHVTPYELLIVASMVEREAQIPGDRAKIAAVIYNRLREGVPLGIDAAIYYAVEQQQGVATYTKELTEAQLHIDSPYNTRTHTGLPPTPISNPGDASIHAAAYPAHVSYLYYVAGADGCGEQVFSDTQSAFEANVAAYKAAVSKNGGHPPTCKHK
jgi:cell division protein YceG involved in septum cleavage